jgi:putative nucleotidyltransferase with HDIG domain
VTTASAAIAAAKGELAGSSEPAATGACIQRAQRAERAGRWGMACAEYERLIRDAATPEETRLAALRWLGRAYLEQGKREAAADVLDAAVAAAKNANNPSAIAQALNVVAILEQTGGNLERAAELYDAAREQAQQAEDRALVAMIDQNAGVVANIRGDTAGALESFRMSLAGYQALGLSSYAGQVLNNMGLAFMELGDLQSAEWAYAKAISEFADHGDQNRSEEVAVNQIQLWIVMGRVDDALSQAKRLLAMGGAAERPWAGEVHRHLGVIAREQSDFAAANDRLAQAAVFAGESEDVLLTADVAEQQAELFWLEERHREMLSCLNRARSIYSRVDATHRLAEVERRNANLEHRFLDIARRWGDSIEGADRYTQGHCQRVADVACMLAERSGIDPRDMFWFRLGALLHDVGKIIVPLEVLNKPGKLTPEEWELMKRHPEAGLELVADVDFPGDVRAIIRNHHERWDGKGYPDGLVGDATPLPARLLCLADVYDALTSSRPYRTALSHQQGVEIMRTSEGQFDPQLLAIFMDWAHAQPDMRACA